MQDDGGPAFPNPKSDLPGSYEAHPGMTLRDWFAGQALAGLSEHARNSKDTAKWAYKLADAMLAARKEAPDDPR